MANEIERRDVLQPEIEPRRGLWKVDESLTQDHWLEVVDPDGWWSAHVKWDGCLEITSYYNAPIEIQGHKRDHKGDDDDDCDSTHICDLDAYIARLQALRDLAIEHFTRTHGGWPG